MRLMINATLPDALRLSGLQGFCRIVNLHYFVGRIRRLRRIRQEQRVLFSNLRGAIAPLFSDWQSVSVYLAQRWLDRLTNRRGQCQRDNQQSEDDAEGHVEAAEQRGNQRTADAADTKA